MGMRNHYYHVLCDIHLPVSSQSVRSCVHDQRVARGVLLKPGSLLFANDVPQVPVRRYLTGLRENHNATNYNKGKVAVTKNELKSRPLSCLVVYLENVDELKLE